MDIFTTMIMFSLSLAWNILSLFMGVAFSIIIFYMLFSLIENLWYNIHYKSYNFFVNGLKKYVKNKILSKKKKKIKEVKQDV